MTHLGLSFIWFMTFFAVDAAAENSYFWSPMKFGGGVELQYRWAISQSGQRQNLNLTIEFVEHYDGEYDVVATLTNGKTIVVTEPRVDYLYAWAIGKIQNGPLVATEDNLPMVATANLVASSMAYFWGISRDVEDWRQGFSATHPNFPGMTVTVTSDSCTAAGLTGKVFKLDGAGGAMTACLSPDFGLPLTLTGTNAAGERSEYVLQTHHDRKLVVPKLFHNGEPGGFDNILWGTDIGAVTGLVLHDEESETVTVYRKPGSGLTVWGIPFTSIDYYFKDGKFAKVIGKIDSDEDWGPLKDELFKEYGRAFKETDMFLDEMDSYVWRGEEQTTIRLESPGYDSAVRLEMSFNELAWSEFDSLWDDLFEGNE